VSPIFFPCLLPTNQLPHSQTELKLKQSRITVAPPERTTHLTTAPPTSLPLGPSATAGPISNPTTQIAIAMTTKATAPPPPAVPAPAAAMAPAAATAPGAAITKTPAQPGPLAPVIFFFFFFFFYLIPCNEANANAGTTGTSSTSSTSGEASATGAINAGMNFFFLLFFYLFNSLDRSECQRWQCRRHRRRYVYFFPLFILFHSLYPSKCHQRRYVFFFSSFFIYSILCIEVNANSGTAGVIDGGMYLFCSSFLFI